MREREREKERDTELRSRVALERGRLHVSKHLAISYITQLPGHQSRGDIDRLDRSGSWRDTIGASRHRASLLAYKLVRGLSSDKRRAFEGSGDESSVKERPQWVSE